VVGVADEKAVGRERKLEFVDLQTLQAMAVPARKADLSFQTGHSKVRASANGRLFGSWETGISPQGVRTLVLEGGIAQTYYNHSSSGYIAPDPEGRLVHTAFGRYTNQARDLLSGPKGISGATLPGHHGPYWVKLDRSGEDGSLSLLLPPGQRPRPTSTLTIHLGGDSRALATIKDVELGGVQDYWSGANLTLTLDKRVHLIPQANLVVVLPDRNDRLILYRVDLEKALEKSAVDYLLVTSQPTTTARRGEAYHYPLMVRSRKGNVRYRLDLAPPGMRLTPEGVLEWQVPQDLAESVVPVLITVGDASGKEIFHRFEIAVRP
jgi:hypothetical protein